MGSTVSVTLPTGTRLPQPTPHSGHTVTLPPGVLAQDFLNHSLAGQGSGLQIRNTVPASKLAVLQGFLGLQLPTDKYIG